MSRVLLVAAMLAAAICGLVFADAHYRLSAPGRASDQLPLAHRDSAYTSSTWVVSEAENYLQLRFFERVEGGICLRPTWAELAELTGADGARVLPHLAPAEPVPPRGELDRDWPKDLPPPSPGTLNNSAYISLFPAGLLLNERLMAAAGGELRRASPRILIVGLGSGVGAAHLAHHVPDAAITVVDIDHVVRGMVEDHYPLLRWLTTRRTAAGEPRLELPIEDARRFIRYEGARRVAAGRGFDLIILDAYTAGSTIPPHLMTREFFSLCERSLAPGGLVLANIIGSYGIEQDGRIVGQMHRVLGGALRSLRAAGLPELWCFPVLNPGWWMMSDQKVDAPSTFDQVRERSRNNIVICGRDPIDPARARAGWERLARHVPYPELTSRPAWSSATWVAYGSTFSSAVPAAPIDAQAPALAARLKELPYPADAAQYQRRRVLDQSGVEDLRRAAIAWSRQSGHRIAGWDGQLEGALRIETDWVRFPREIWRVALHAARDASRHSGDVLVGPVDPPGGIRPEQQPTWAIADAPLFTDQSPNADIWNR